MINVNVEAYILEAIEIVSAWELSDSELPEAITAQAQLMAGSDNCFDETYSHNYMHSYTHNHQ